MVTGRRPGQRRRGWRRRVQLSAALVLSWRPTASNVRRLARSTATSFVALGVTLYILPGRQSTGPEAVVVLVLVVAAVGVLIRPVLQGLSVVFGPVGWLIIGVVAQAIVLDVGLALAPGVERLSLRSVLLASWIAAAIAAIVNWLADTGSDDSFLAQVLGRSIRLAHRLDLPAAPGLLIVQLDGVGEALLRQAITAGAVPTLSRWLNSGTHALCGWHTGLPSTTPAGQAVLLHGDVRTVPSFRWFEKDHERLMVANRPADATEIEGRLSNGRGLLADGGVSVSNLFSGDAPIRLLTMSDARLPATRLRSLASFATSRAGLMRSLVLFVGEMITEVQQGRRQRRRDVRPRVGRGGLYIVLRAVTTVLLRDLNVTIVSEQMARGAPVIFVDFVDYDEVAHHAGPSRPESMRTLDGLDRVLAHFEAVAAEVGRQYEIVVLSDHGQAQGQTFEQRTGRALADVVASSMRGMPIASASADESWGAATVLLTGASRAGSKVADSLLRKRTDTEPASAEAVVAASGSLAHIYLPGLPPRAQRAEVDQRFPGLVDALAAQPGVGAVLVHTPAGARVLGADGWRDLSGAGDGLDPLAVYGPRALADLRDLDGREHVGDLVLLGEHDPVSGDTTAFEDLVGSHGGLGGGQTSAVLIHPAQWAVTPDLDGPAVHALLLDRLRAMGLRPGDIAVKT